MSASKKQSTEEKTWGEKHRPAKKGDAPSRLYTDDDPATTIKGCGFKNACVAERTIWLTSQPGSTHKQYWSIRAMAERAERHPAINRSNNSGMRDAVKVFRKWLGDRKDQELSKLLSPSKKKKLADLAKSEQEQRVALTKTKANAHGKRNCKSEEQFATFAREDRKCGLDILKDNAGSVKKGFRFPVTVFVSIFGGPGEHGYGSHVCLQASEESLPSFRCSCNFNGKHLVTVFGNKKCAGGKFVRDIEVLNLGKRFPLSQFVLEYDGANETAKYVSSKGVAGSGGAQSSIKDFFGVKRKTKSSPSPKKKFKK
eukprot:gene163-976_t